MVAQYCNYLLPFQSLELHSLCSTCDGERLDRGIESAKKKKGDWEHSQLTSHCACQRYSTSKTRYENVVDISSGGKMCYFFPLATNFASGDKVFGTTMSIQIPVTVSRAFFELILEEFPSRSMR